MTRKEEITRTRRPAPFAGKAPQLAPDGAELLSLLRDGIVCTDMAGTVTYWNASATELYGWTPEEMLGTSLFERFPPDVRARVLRIHESVRAGKPEVFDWEDTRKDGRRIWVEARLSLLNDRNGEPAGIIGVSRDVSSRKEAERIVRRDALILSQLQDAVVCLDNAMNVVYWNDAATRIFQWTREEMVGKSILARLPPETHPFVLKVLEHVGQGRDQEEEWEDFRKDGSRVWVNWRAQALENERGEVIGQVSVGTDVTDRRRAEIQRAELERQLFHAQRMETMGTLAGGIAHDFNNILAAILMQTELALESPQATPRIGEALSEIRRSSLRAKVLVSRILTFSRTDDAARAPLDLRGVVREVVNFMRATLPASVSVRHEPSPSGPPALGNATQLHQVLINIASNGAQAMPSGGELEFQVSTRVCERPLTLATNTISAGTYVVARVSDTGTGMDEMTLKHLFEPFYTTKPPGAGTGLGLAIARTIAQNHGGGIHVESTLGAGSVFTVYVPVAPAHAKEPSVPPTPRAKVPGRGERILLVDDEESIAVLTRAALESLGFVATHATSPEEFLKLFEANPSGYDLIITDQTMHRTTGLELASLLRSRGHMQPIIVATGNRGRVDLEALKSLAPATILDKPFEIARLGTAVSEMLKATRVG